MKLRILSFCCVVVILSSCFEKEEPIQAFPRGDVEELQVELGPKYTHQIFYSLVQNEVIKSVLRTDWDMSFNCSADNFTIYLNTGNSLYAAKTKVFELTDINDTAGAGLDFKWDWSNGYDDSTAMAGWDLDNNVYVINLGYDIDGVALGFVKAKFTKVGQELHITYAMLAESTEKSAVLKKDDTYNRVYFSFTRNVQVDIEPPKENYDLVFRQYIYYFVVEDLSYNVVGVLVNPYQTRTMSINDIEFLNITLEDTSNYEFKMNWDVVGYDWKEFNLNEGFYVVYPNKNFIFQSPSGFFYKFHFVDFYNMDGDRGYPKIESKLL